MSKELIEKTAKELFEKEAAKLKDKAGEAWEKYSDVLFEIARLLAELQLAVYTSPPDQLNNQWAIRNLEITAEHTLPGRLSHETDSYLKDIVETAAATMLAAGLSALKMYLDAQISRSIKV